MLTFKHNSSFVLIFRYIVSSYADVKVNNVIEIMIISSFSM